MKKPYFCVAVLPFIFPFCLVIGYKQKPAEKAETETTAQEDVLLAEIPQAIIDTLKAKFSEAVIDKWTREKEGEIVIYDIEFKQQERKFEADVKEDGSIHNWEQAIATEDLPEVVRQAAEKLYPNAVLKEIMMITAVVDGRDELEGYEIVLQTANDKEVEITVATDGTVKEDSGK